MSAENTEGFQTLQEKFGRFRILIVGRANAGKTTILQRICNTTEKPEIYDGDGNKLDLTKVEGSTERGIHTIENELIFRSNDKLVFHDSQGFEAGREDEFLQMKKFIADRANTTILKKRIHAIWFCIPMDEFERAILRAEEMFFEECDPGNVPVVVLFTKFDALLPVALGKLIPADRRLPPRERLSKAELLMEGIFNSTDIWGRLAQMKHAPKFYVQIGGMDKSSEGCTKLVETTTGVLGEEALQMLLVSAQEVNIALCVRYAARELIGMTDKVYNSSLSIANMSEQVLQKLAWWFPHVQELEFWEDSFWFWLWRELELDKELVFEKRTSFTQSDQQALTPHNGIPFSTWKQILEAGVDIILISEHSFFLCQKNDPQPFSSASQNYKASNSPGRARKALEEVFKKYKHASYDQKVEMVTDVILQNHMASTS